MRGRLRLHGFLSAVVALSCLSVAVVGIAGPAKAQGLPPIPPPPSSGTPACTFNGSSFNIITGVSNGDKIAVSCTGLPALHPYLIFQASLLIGIDPKAAALLAGGAPGPGTITGALAALPEIDVASFTVELSDPSGNMNFNYTVPTAQAVDPNASCPPGMYFFNAGVLGCALAMVDLTTQKSLPAGQAVMEWVDYPLFPPNPALTLSATKHLQAGQSLDTANPGATSFWWVATLNDLTAALSGGSAPPPTTTVQFLGRRHSVVSADNTVAITGASYDGKTLTPPSISGSIIVPNGLTGRQTVSVTYIATVSGQSLGQSATEKVKM